MQGRFNNVSIKGIFSVVPKHLIRNEVDYKHAFTEKQISKQVKATGIHTRHVVDKSTSMKDLAISSVKYLLECLNWDKDSIDAIILVTQTPEYVLPSTSFYLHKELGIGKQCACFDINLGCSGYVAGLGIAGGYLQGITKGKKRAILVDADTLSKYIDKLDLSTCLLFGDAATSTAIEIEENNELLYSLNSDGTGYQAIHKYSNSYLKMDGTKVFEFTIGQVVDSILGFMKDNNLQDKDVDYYVFHQAQKFVVSNMAEILNINDNKVLFSLDKYGNTAGASIPITICNNRLLLQEKKEVRLLFAGFGVGLSWGCTYVTMNTECIHDIVTMPDS